MKTIIFLIGLFLGLFLAVIVILQRPKADTIIREVEPIIESWSAWDIFIEEGTEFAEVAMAQLILETGGMTSKIYKENGNGFGMKPNDTGDCIGTKNGHADYGKDFRKSVRDFVRWQKKHIKGYEQATGIKIKTNEQYIKFLGDVRKPWKGDPKKSYRYAEDPHYEDKLRALLKYVHKVKEIQMEPAPGE